jgi:ABC-type transport system substrate-binding protein
LGDVLVSQLASLGLSATVIEMGPAQLEGAIQTGSYDLAVISRTVMPDPDTELAAHTCLGNDEPTGLISAAGTACSMEFNDLYNAQHITQDAGQRATLVSQAYTFLYEQAAIIGLYHPSNLEAFSTTAAASLGQVPSGSDTTGITCSANSYWGFYRAEPPQADPGPVEPVPEPAPLPEAAQTDWIVIAAIIGVALTVAVALIVRNQIRTTRRSKTPTPPRQPAPPHPKGPNYGEFIGH